MYSGRQMRRIGPIFFLVALATTACSREPAGREYQLQGQILGIQPERNEVLIKHGDIKGFMPGMTMPFTVKDPALLTGKTAGDLVTATLVVSDNTAHLSTLTRTGHAALDLPATPPAPPILQPGEPVADAAFVDQDGRQTSLAALRGHRVALTFIYTRCPLPDYCPLMDRHFVAVQKRLQANPALADVRLVTATLDPAFDTPAVLKAHGERLGADPGIWSLVTAAPDAMAAFGRQFDLYVERNEQDAIDITHNLRTVVIDAGGRLVKMRTGNDWIPADLIGDLEAAPAPAH
jgi:protein SCO1